MTIQYLIMQIIYWCIWCSLFSFANSFLSSSGFLPSHIGYIVATGSIFSVITQPITAKLIDEYTNITVKRATVFSFFTISLSSLILIFTSNKLFIIIAYVVGLVGLFNIQTYMYPLIFEYINAGYKVNFGLARGMGSISFSISSLIIGNVISKYGTSSLSIILFILSLLALFSMLLFKPIKANKEKEIIKSSFKDFYNNYRNFCFVLLGISLLFFTHNIVNTYLKDILNSINYAEKEVGISYMIAAAVELPVMLMIPFLNKKFTYGKLFIISAFGFTAKAAISLLSVLSSSLFVNYLAQFSQIFAFALYTPVSLYYANSILKDEDFIKGQTYLGTALTLGGITGNLLGGKIYELSSIPTLLIISVTVSFIGFLLILFNIKKSN